MPFLTVVCGADGTVRPTFAVVVDGSKQEPASFVGKHPAMTISGPGTPLAQVRNALPAGFSVMDSIAVPGTQEDAFAVAHDALTDRTPIRGEHDINKLTHLAAAYDAWVDRHADVTSDADNKDIGVWNIDMGADAAAQGEFIQTGQQILSS